MACCQCAKEAPPAKRTITREKEMERQRKYREDNREARRSRQRNHQTRYSQQNPERIVANNAKRRGSQILRTPQWLSPDDLEAIEDFYAACRMFRMYTGQDYHVDHIVPLKGRTVSGLHVPWNLQVLPAQENLMKGNR